MLVGYWLLLAFARAALGEAGNERYLYPGALFVLLVVLELARSASLPARAWPLVALGLALITLTNIGLFGGQLGPITQSNHQTGPIGRIEAGRAARLAAPVDRDPATPWRVRVLPAVGVSACAPSG